MKLLSSNKSYVRDILTRIGTSLAKEGERRSPCDIVVRDDSLYYRLIARGSPVFLEGHMYKQWDCAEACIMYVAQAIPQIDAAGAEKRPFRT